MKCPLFESMRYIPHYQGTEQATDCLQEECAWWHKKWDHCALLSIASIAEHIEQVDDTLQCMLVKMPDELQLRK